jgi:hypothetical protein
VDHLSGDCPSHPPIETIEDEGPNGFALANVEGAAAVPRPGSGVLAGTGTADDPYLIQG